MSCEHERHEEPTPRKEGKQRNSNILSSVITLALLVAVCIAVAAVFQVLSSWDPQTRDREKLQQLGFSNIQLEPVKGSMRAWVSVGGCRIHLERAAGIDENWHLFGESIVAGISGEPTAEQIRNHEKYRGCAKQPVPAKQTR